MSIQPSIVFLNPTKDLGEELKGGVVRVDTLNVILREAITKNVDMLSELHLKALAGDNVQNALVSRLGVNAALRAISELINHSAHGKPAIGSRPLRDTI